MFYFILQISTPVARKNLLRNRSLTVKNYKGYVYALQTQYLRTVKDTFASIIMPIWLNETVQLFVRSTVRSLLDQPFFLLIVLYFPDSKIFFSLCALIIRNNLYLC